MSVSRIYTYVVQRVMQEFGLGRFSLSGTREFQIDRTSEWITPAGMPMRRLNGSDVLTPHAQEMFRGCPNCFQRFLRPTEDTTESNQFVGSKEANCERTSRSSQIWQG